MPFHQRIDVDSSRCRSPGRRRIRLHRRAEYDGLFSEHHPVRDIWYLLLFYVVVTEFKRIAWVVVIALILVVIAELLSPKS